MRMLRVSLIALTWLLLLHHEAISITIATGSQEGTYYKIAQDIKQIAEKEGIPIEIISTNGSFDNINLLGAGKVDLAIMQLDVLKICLGDHAKGSGLQRVRASKGRPQSLFGRNSRHHQE
jgi:TRAP-type uncharacterized transport system substrate-binding protein